MGFLPCFISRRASCLVSSKACFLRYFVFSRLFLYHYFKASKFVQVFIPDPINQFIFIGRYCSCLDSNLPGLKLVGLPRIAPAKVFLRRERFCLISNTACPWIIILHNVFKAWSAIWPFITTKNPTRSCFIYYLLRFSVFH